MQHQKGEQSRIADLIPLTFRINCTLNEIRAHKFFATTGKGGDIGKEAVNKTS